jgi:hypothetical protein
MAALCEHYSIGPAAVRDATSEEVDALVRRMQAAADGQ